MLHRTICTLALGSNLLVTGMSAGSARAGELPRYEHVVVIVAENASYSDILKGDDAPNLQRLARAYGSASRFFAEAHPSEPNYVALLGGDTFGIRDDDAFYCRMDSTDRSCPGAAASDYPDHTVLAPHLGLQLARAGLTWRGYYEDLPQPGSIVVEAGSSRAGGKSVPVVLYASKHSGFLNFADVQADPHRADHLVGFDRLNADLAAGWLPNFALIVPNQCNDMHGEYGPGVPADCDWSNRRALIRRGDQAIGNLVSRLQDSAAWRSAGHFAIVITFDEGNGREGCCRATPDEHADAGGWIPTLVLTNHGPRGRVDDTPYNHYSLLRTIEDIFGLPEHLGLAADAQSGGIPMCPLFTTDGAPMLPGRRPRSYPQAD